MKEKTGVGLLLFLILMIVVVSAEKLDISVENNFIPGDEVHFKIFIYDDSNNVIAGRVSYVIEDYYTDVVDQGVADSGRDNIFNLPRDAIQGPWRITVRFGDIEVNRLFNVGELEKVEIKLEKDNLIIRNIGNVPYDKKILIYIGEQDQIADIYLEIGQEKNIKLTAPEGLYEVKVVGDDVVSETGQEDDITYSGVSLTGKVVGIETALQGNFWQRYPIVAVFIIAVIALTVIVGIARVRNKFSSANVNVRVSNKNIQKK